MSQYPLAGRQYRSIALGELRRTDSCLSSNKAFMAAPVGVYSEAASAWIHLQLLRRPNPGLAETVLEHQRPDLLDNSQGVNPAPPVCSIYHVISITTVKISLQPVDSATVEKEPGESCSDNP